MTNNKQSISHHWRFVSTAAFNQLLCESVADVTALAQLDRKQWAVLSCPAGSIEFDTRTLARIDTDKDGRVHFPATSDTVEWMARAGRSYPTILRAARRRRDCPPSIKVLRKVDRCWPQSGIFSLI